MKKIIIMSVALVLFAVLSSRAQNKNKDHFTIKVDGLGCAFCAYGLEKKFQKLDGISDIKIDLEKGIFDFDFKTEKNLSLDEVKYQVVSSGYTPISGKVIRSNGKEETANFTTGQIKSGTEASTISVSGNCTMCKTRIEKAALSVNGVANASWDLSTKLLTVELSDSKTTLQEVEKAIANVGHDTGNVKADDATYNQLHTCCKYDRK